MSESTQSMPIARSDRPATFYRWAYLLLIGACGALAACGGGHGGSPPPAATQPETGTATPNAASGAATLTWSPPTQRTDGSQLTDLARYNIYWGTDAATLVHHVVLDQPGVTTFVVEPLTAQTWFFAVSAVDAAGRESTRSNVVSKTIR